MIKQKLKKLVFILIVIVLVVTVKHFDSMAVPKQNLKVEKRLDGMNLEKSEKTPKEFLKIFHLDLKGGPPRLQYLLKILPIIRRAGANAILIEYEDMFPFSGPLKNVSAENAYSTAEVKRLVKFVESLKMELIPLVQTFGHLEYLLKLEEFQSLRELESFPQEICPRNKEAVDLVKEMIRQCMALHPNSKYIHIGCDEVRHVGACSRCSRLNSKKIFANHVIKIAEYVRRKYPGVTPLIWDDMLRRWTYIDMEDSGLESAVEPVVWVYGNNIFTLVPPFIWNMYKRTFPRIWVASAFKGASGETKTLPDLTRHLENQLSWMRILSGEDEINLRTEISGIFLTGWSRYDHFAVLCELLPVGIPSLLLSLTFLDRRLLENPREGFSKWLRVLNCPPNFLLSNTQNETFFHDKLGNCSFPGSNLYSGVVEFEKLRSRVKEVEKRVESSGWTSQYNLQKNFTSPWRLLEMFPEEGFAGEALRKELSTWKSAFSVVLDQYFDRHTRLEWEEQNVKPLERKLLEISTNFQNLLVRKTWPRRPIRQCAATLYYKYSACTDLSAQEFLNCLKNLNINKSSEKKMKQYPSQVQVQVPVKGKHIRKGNRTNKISVKCKKFSKMRKTYS